MLFGNAHVEAPAWMDLCEQIQSRSIGHGRRHGDDLVVAAGLVDEGIGENLGIRRRVRGRLLLLARHHIEGGGRVPLVARGLGRSVSLALLGDDVDQHGPGRPRLDRAQDRQKLVKVMPVDGAQIAEPQFLKQRPADNGMFQKILGPLGAFAEGFRQKADRALGGGLQFLERVSCVKPRQISRHRADGRSDGHLVVVQDDDQPLAKVARVVHRLIGHACRNRPVADHRDGVAQTGLGGAAKIARDGKAKRRADRGRGMRRTERIIGALRPFGEATQTTLFAQRANAVAPPGQDLVRIALMRDVPDQLVARRVEHGVQRNGQFHHAETRAQVTARLADRTDRLSTQLVSKTAQLWIRKAFHVGRGHDSVQRGCIRSLGHAYSGLRTRATLQTKLPDASCPLVHHISRARQRLLRPNPALSGARHQGPARIRR